MINSSKKNIKIIKSVQDEHIETRQYPKLLPILIPSDLYEYNVDGFAKLHHENLLLRTDNQLQYDSIEDAEIEETSRDYTYYEKNHAGKVHKTQNDADPPQQAFPDQA